MQSYLEDMRTGGCEPIDVDVTDEGQQLCISMKSKRTRDRLEMALHIDKDLLHDGDEDADKLQREVQDR